MKPLQPCVKVEIWLAGKFARAAGKVANAKIRGSIPERALCKNSMNNNVICIISGAPNEDVYFDKRVSDSWLRTSKYKENKSKIINEQRDTNKYFWSLHD